ncbi:helix-turn-helix domain-containing protein [Brevibacillus antibioticus]|uniref:Helix-turn-helix domain-containing protein n=1 Tax=Brevibacillus antibioticus TaxID=2570228 RepID=A0A4U2XYE5_9BACL|nr:helix-turn-helix transcriptional regulator [Brevibacillus antibioticus]TKI52940.1 helix-turn-helix domain-containing protein [Brevibacillus antibioticus]
MIGEFVKHLRSKKRLTVIEVSYHADVSATTVYALERGRDFKNSNLERIVQALGLDMIDFYQLYGTWLSTKKKSVS